MKRKLSRPIAGALVAIALSALMLEGGIRLLRLIPDDAPIPYRPMPGDEHYAPVPNESARSLYGISYRTDSHGLRGPERSLDRVPHRLRVAILGDSVVFGLGIAEDQTIPAWLERLAQRQRLDLEAWNLGVPANNTYHEKARFVRLAPLLQPDATIIVMLYNDLEAGPGRYRVTSARTLSNASRHAPYPDAWRPALESSALFQAMIRLYTAGTRRQGEDIGLAYLQRILDQLDEIAGTANAAGSALIVTAMPGPWPDAAGYAEFATGLKQYCAQRKLAFIDLSTALGNPGRSEYFLPADSVHPTAEGARLIAEALLPSLAQALNGAKPH
jgi:lysophospholipase L1-like esterase